MAVFTYAWSSLPRFSLDAARSATGDDIDDIYVELPEEAHNVLTAVSFSGGSWYFHSHSGTTTFEILARVKATQEWVVAWSQATTGNINISGLSITTTAFDADKLVVDAIRLRAVPFQATAFHSMTSSGDMTVDVKPKAGTAGAGGGGGGAGVGNMLGGFTLGSTMLGADVGSGGGGAGGSGTGNMLGGFWLGQTMLGADPSGGGGDAAPINVGAIHQAQAVIAGLANVSGAFATFVFPVAANPVGMAVVQNAYLNSNWPLAASTINPTGITKSVNAGNHNILPGIDQQVQSRTATYTVDAGVNNTLSSFNVTVYKQPLGGGAETTAGGVSGNAGRTYSQTVDAGAGFFISRIVLNNQGHRVTWEWWVEPSTQVAAVIFSPIGLRSTVEAQATVTGNMSVHILDGDTCTGEATVTAEAYRVIPLKPQNILANSQVVVDLQNVKDLYADVLGEGTVQAEAVLTDVVFGTSDVIGYLEIHNTRGRAIGIATVTANLRRNEGFGGDSKGDTEVVGEPRLALVMEGACSAFATAIADLTYPAPFSGGSITGDSTALGVLAIYNVRGSIAGEATVTASQSYVGPLQMRATSAGAASLTFEMRIRGRFGQQQINGDSTVTCPAIIRVWFVDGTAAGDSVVEFDDLTIHFPAPGPIVCDSEVVAHATHDARYGGEIEGEATVAPTFPYVQTTVGTASPQGTADTRGRLYVRPQDFEASTSDGSAAVLGQVLVSVLSLKAKSEGGKTYTLDAQGKETTAFSLNFVTGYLSTKAPFAPVRIEGYAEFDRAILLLNDSGLVVANSRLEAFLDFKTGVGDGQARGYSVNRGQFDFASDLRGVVTNAYAGVGKWFPNGFSRIYHFDFSLTMAPIPDIHPSTGFDHTGLPGNAVWHGASSSQYFGVSVANNATRDTYLGGNVWDGSYEEWRLQDMVGLDWRLYPELWDPDLGSTTNVNQAQPYRVFPGPLRRKYALLQKGVLGTWMVDTRGPGFNDKAMRAGPVGEARFDEPHSTVDMDLDLKSSMKGRIECYSFVVAAALLLSFRTFLAEGNVTALRYLTQSLAGNAAKSPEALLPMTRENVDLLNPVRQSNAMYV